MKFYLDIKKIVKPNILDCNAYIAGKPIEEVQKLLGLKDVIKLASNENPLGPSPKAVETIMHYVHSLNYYPDDANVRFKAALAGHWNLKPGNIFVGNGSMQLLELICKTFVGGGDEVVAGKPSFRVFYELVRAAGGNLVEVPLKNYVHDLPAMLKAITGRTKLVIICNPNNPTGTVVSHEEINEYLKNVPDHLITILDEAYIDFADNFRDPLDYLKTGKKLIILRSFSKIYGLAGLRLGYGITTEDVSDMIERARMPFTVSLLAQTAGISALKDEEFRLKTIENNNEVKALMYKRFEEMGLEYVPTQANFIAVNVKTDDLMVFNELLKEGVIVFAGTNTFMPGFLRVTIGTPSQAERFLKALEKVLSAHKTYIK
ncbi:MAG: histidinol-phosphate transaminase [Firmicutes bacterium]|nr:histidinol-phosphate transaminase [Bacillota bacterium]